MKEKNRRKGRNPVTVETMILEPRCAERVYAFWSVAGKNDGKISMHPYRKKETTGMRACAIWVKLVLSSLLLLLLSSAAIAEEIVLVADPWPPFNNELDSEQEGYMVDVTRVVFESLGHKVIYKIIPWRRAIEETRSGRYTAAIGASRTDARGFLFPDEELARNILSFYIHKDSQWQFNGPASIETVSIGVAAGYDYRHWLNDYIRSYSADEQRVQIIAGTHPLKQNLKKLLLKRIDVVVDTEAAIRFQAREMGVLDKIKPAGYGVEPAYLYIAFSPRLPESSMLARQLSDGIVELRRSGQLKAILDQYGLSDWK